MIIFAFIVSLVSLAFAFFSAWKLKKQKIESKKVEEISLAIREGALAFLKKEYRILAIFGLIVFLFLGFIIDFKIALAFALGSLLSVASGNIGMRAATLANARTAEALKKNIKKGLWIAFSSGSIMAFSVVSLSVLGIIALFWLFKDPNIIFGFGFGASAVALFARVGGGIYTKAADIGADIVGKVEVGIPEDDPRNPAVIADNVGDNVGDVAGMGADLFESYADSLIAAIVLGSTFYLGPKIGLSLPLGLAALGIIASLLGNLFVKIGKKSPDRQLNRGVFWATALTTIFSYFLIKRITESLDLFWAFSAGLFAGVMIGFITQYYTSASYQPTRNLSASSKTGPATNIIAGLALGMKSVLWPVIFVCGAIYSSYYFGGLYGVSIASLGMLSTLGITLATDSYGPVADNAAGIAEMAGMGSEVRERAESLDAVGNTTAAVGKGFAIGSAALTALVLIASFAQAAEIKIFNLLDPKVIIGLFIGGAMPFLFSSFAMSAVGKAAMKMVEEVRRQFREISGLLEGKTKPDYGKTVSISTNAALKEMVVPSSLAIIAPIIIGFWLGKATLGGFLIGSLVSGFLLAIMMANAGGAWDNAKKYIESGQLGGKGSDPHKAAVIGDTVGDPFKDTAGPSLNILIKLMSIIAVIIAPLL
ncbi:MAG: sodium-translocating pyrophosphatase [Parcubacteria group bacterium]|nr:sodium-translocating pyrophosphatase [Parcubacteria group bacterium]